MIFYKAPEMDKHTYTAVGSCIYCGSTNSLSDEHIIPYGLGGNLILPKSSCNKCASITSKSELKVMNGSMLAVRILREIQSRSNYGKAPKTYPILLKFKNEIQEIQVSIENYPAIVSFPIFSEPNFWECNEGGMEGINLTGVTNISFGSNPEDILRKYSADSFSIPIRTDHPTDFARMVAKIAFSTAVAIGAFKKNNHLNSYVLPAIVGKKDNIGRWVGTFKDPVISSKHHLHRVLIHRDLENKLLIGDVQLFSDSDTPRYCVILGEI